MFAVLILQPLFKFFFNLFFVNLDFFHPVQMVPCLFMGQLHHVGFIQPPEHLGSHFVFRLYPFKMFLKG